MYNNQKEQFKILQNQLTTQMDQLAQLITLDHMKIAFSLILGVLSYLKLSELKGYNTSIKNKQVKEINNQSKQQLKSKNGKMQIVQQRSNILRNHSMPMRKQKQSIQQAQKNKKVTPTVQNTYYTSYDDYLNKTYAQRLSKKKNNPSLFNLNPQFTDCNITKLTPINTSKMQQQCQIPKQVQMKPTISEQSNMEIYDFSRYRKTPISTNPITTPKESILSMIYSSPKYQRIASANPDIREDYNDEFYSDKTIRNAFFNHHSPNYLHGNTCTYDTINNQDNTIRNNRIFSSTHYGQQFPTLNLSISHSQEQQSDKQKKYKRIAKTRQNNHKRNKKVTTNKTIFGKSTISPNYINIKSNLFASRQGYRKN